MPSRAKSRPEVQHIVVEPCGPGEWIVDVPGLRRALDVYQLAPCDWLVSEVGRDNEGRGADLIAALTVLFAGSSLDLWGPLVAGAAVMQALNEICRRASRM
jgi:sarcosine oxidase gamma subunit